jgi:diguanylate cyclase (GGDEF)-like protein/PAS domain S-box-containing protein
MTHTIHESGFTWLFNAAPDAMLVADRAGRFIAANPRAEALFRRSRTNLLTLGVEDLVPARLRSRHQRLREGWQSHPDARDMGASLHCVGLRADGTEFPAEISLSPLEAEDAGLVLVALRDASERRQAQEQIFHERERALVTLASINDAVITTDASGVVDYLNPSAVRLTGRPAERALHRPIEETFPIVSEAGEAGLTESVRLCLRGGLSLSSDQGSLRQADGFLLPVAFNIAPLRSSEGRLSGMVVVFRDIVQQRRIARRLSHEATHDALTGLVNRQEFERRLQHLVQSAVAPNVATLCFFDLDRFKQVNDRCGHQAGDAVLHQVALILNESVRQRDTVARLGGDEFVALLENCALEEGIRVAAKIQRAVGEAAFAWHDHTFHLGISAGVTTVGAGVSAEDVLLSADGACYASKARGGTDVVVATPSGPACS